MKTEGMSLHYLSGNTVKNIGCFAAFNDSGDKVGIIEQICVGNSVNTRIAGKIEPGTISFTIALDSTKQEHKDLINALYARQPLDFCCAFSDGATAVTYNAGSKFTAVGRTLIISSVIVTEVKPSFEDNAEIKYEISMQRANTANIVWKV